MRPSLAWANIRLLTMHRPDDKEGHAWNERDVHQGRTGRVRRQGGPAGLHRLQGEGLRRHREPAVGAGGARGRAQRRSRLHRRHGVRPSQRRRTRTVPAGGRAPRLKPAPQSPGVWYALRREKFGEHSSVLSAERLLPGCPAGLHRAEPQAARARRGLPGGHRLHHRLPEAGPVAARVSAHRTAPPRPPRPPLPPGLPARRGPAASPPTSATVPGRHDHRPPAPPSPAPPPRLPRRVRVVRQTRLRLAHRSAAAGGGPHLPAGRGGHRGG